MGFEELVEQLKGARGVLVRDRERIDDEINRVDAAIRVLDGAPATEVATIAFEHNVDVMVPRTTKAERGTTTIDYAAVAAWIKAAKSDGTYTQQRMADHFGKPVSTVRNWLNACRGLGLLEDGDLQRGPAPATPAPVKAAEAPAKPAGKMVLRCADCGWECATDKAANLDLHCRGTHRRPATTAERTPVAAA